MLRKYEKDADYKERWAKKKKLRKKVFVESGTQCLC